MSRSKRVKEREAYRSVWTSTEDLEETIAAMFPAPQPIVVELDAKTPTGGILEVPTVGALKEPTEGDLLSHITRKPVTGESEIKTPTGGILEVPTVGALETPTPFELIFSPETLPGDPITRKTRLRRIHSVQDGLTPGEWLLLTEMFKSAAVQTGSKDRIAKAGYRTLSELTAQDPKTVKRNRQALEKKLCIDPLGQNTFTDAAAFRVFHFHNILLRWRDRGWVWVCRLARSVELVARSETPTGGTLKTPTGGASKMGIGKTPTGGGGKTPTGGGGILTPSLLSLTSKENIEPATTAAWPLTARAFFDSVGRVDDDGIRKLVEACQAQAPDIRDREVADLVVEEAIAAARDPRTMNRAGAVITYVPKRCTPGALALWREPRAKERLSKIEILRNRLQEPEGYSDRDLEEFREKLHELENE